MQMYPVMCFPHIFTSRVRSCHSPLDWYLLKLDNIMSLDVADSHHASKRIIPD